VSKRPEAFPWPGRQRFFEAGEVRLAVLSLLSEGPKHGYQIMKELQEIASGVSPASAGSVYPTLEQLEEEGLAQAGTEAGRRVYRLTRAGRKEAASDPAALKRIFDRAKIFEDWGSVMGPMGMLVEESIKASARVGSRRVREVLERARRQMEEL
jgi:DNA-binding PadR family transcriptional regulator